MLTLNYRYRIYPNKQQEDSLTEILEICRSAYNYALREIKDWCGSRKCSIDRCSLVSEYIIPADEKFPSELKQLNSLPKAKKQFPKLKKVPSQVLQQTIKQLHRAWDYFRSRGYGFPRFKKYGQFKSILFPQFEKYPISGNKLRLPKIGEIRIRMHREIPSGFSLKQVRVVRKADRWYAIVCIQCDVDVPNPPPHGYAIGVDIGLKEFLATSDGFFVKPPRFFKTMQRKLGLLQRRLSRKKRGSKNYYKQRLKVARLHHKIDNARKNFHYQTAHQLCNQADMIFVEDLDFRRTAKGMFGKQMLDAGFGQFRQILKEVCWKRGKYFAEVEAKGSTQTCPRCSTHVGKDLSVRIHECPQCNLVADRDVAAACVLRSRGIEKINSTVGQVGSKTPRQSGCRETGIPVLDQWCNPIHGNN